MPAVFEDGAENITSLDAALKDKNALDLIRRFIGDAACSSLLVERTAVREAEEQDSPREEKEIAIYRITKIVHFNQGKMSSLVCLKKGQVIEGEKSIASQLRVISLSDGNAYETLHSYVSAAIAP